MSKSVRVAAVLTAGLLAAGAGQAASVSYYLDQSNILPDGVNYAKVTISDGIDGGEGGFEAAAVGDIDFTVELLQPLKDLVANCDIGITKFAFNIVEGINSPLSAIDISGLPAGWAKGPQLEMDGFGIFDRRLRVTDAHTPLSDVLQFSIVGVDFDTVLSYVDLSQNSTEGPAFFAIRVNAIGGADCDDCSLDAFIGGVTAVPAPPAVWLMLTGVAALVGRRLRARTAA